MAVLHCEGLNFYYNKADEPTLNDVSFSVDEGEFVMLMGASGCGKTTLLRLLKPEIAPLGKLRGKIAVFGRSQQKHEPTIGYVPQDPESGSVSDTVRGEVCFGAENLGLSPEQVSRRVAETVSFFGIGRLMMRKLSELSGGEKQLVSLCSVMAMRPEILLLDEPLSRLDPLAAANFSELLRRVNRELGTTVIIAEHCAEQLFVDCDGIIFMEKGRITAKMSPREAAKQRSFASFMPAAAQVFTQDESVPLTVREGRTALLAAPHHDLERNASAPLGDEVLCCSGLRFAYDRSGAEQVSDADISLHRGELLALAGANGSGKTTLLRCLSGELRPFGGSIKLMGKSLKKRAAVLAVLPQDAQDVFLQPTVGEDYRYALKAMERSPDEAEKMLEKLGIAHLENMHPYDLSGGELQRCALGRVLLCEPRVLLLDEPTKGLDPESEAEIGRLLRQLCAEGVACLAVTHSLNFAANYADTCGIFCGGRAQSVSPAAEFFADAGFYTTESGRIARGISKNVYTVEQLRLAAGRTI
ncbi:MAG: ATP-binding cassette domain-containing protein [Ruminococcus sp.]|nr:ATP-binding cassette domain-containing protein [Ruminococcus sp.]